MPNPPPTEGLPALLQIGVTLLFGVLSVAVLWRSIRSAEPHTQSTVAHLADMQPVRDLRDAVLALIGWMERLCAQLHDSEHWVRNNIEEAERLRKSIDNLTRSLDRWRAD